MSEAQDANLATAPSAEATPANSESTPVAAQTTSESAVKTESTPFHEHPRFKDLISEKNALKQELESLKSQVSKTLERQSTGSLEAETAKELLDLGVKEDAAKRMASRFVKTAQEAANSRVQELEKAVQAMRYETMIKDFESEHSDFKEMQSAMHGIFTGLDPQTQAMVASSPQGLSMLYNQAKANSVESIRKAEYEKGLKDGLTKKQEKQAGSPSSGAAISTPQGQFSDEAIANMSLEDFTKNKEAIYKARGMRNKF